MKAPASIEQNSAGHLRLFVYGSLKKGFWNHERFCTGVVSIQEAEVSGRLYDLGAYPALKVQEECILAKGTVNPRADVATQARFEAKAVPHAGLLNSGNTRHDWPRVRGELMTFDDPKERLPRLDRLEGFHPGGPSLYYRLLVPAITGKGIILAWTYVASENLLRMCGSPVDSWPT